MTFVAQMLVQQVDEICFCWVSFPPGLQELPEIPNTGSLVELQAGHTGLQPQASGLEVETFTQLLEKRQLLTGCNVNVLFLLPNQHAISGKMYEAMSM